jgi:hypothetical protein
MVLLSVEYFHSLHSLVVWIKASRAERRCVAFAATGSCHARFSVMLRNVEICAARRKMRHRAARDDDRRALNGSPCFHDANGVTGIERSEAGGASGNLPQFVK